MPCGHEVHAGDYVGGDNVVDGYFLTHQIVAEPLHVMLLAEPVGNRALAQVGIHYDDFLAGVGKAGGYVAGDERLAHAHIERGGHQHRAGAAFGLHIVDVGAHHTHCFAENLGALEGIFHLVHTLLFLLLAVHYTAPAADYGDVCQERQVAHALQVAPAAYLGVDEEAAYEYDRGQEDAQQQAQEQYLVALRIDG